MNLRNLYQEEFQKAGFEVATAFDGKNGIEQLSKFHPEIILLDIQMPRMTGFDVLNQIKDNPETKDILLIVTSNIHTDNADLVKNYGVSYVIPKIDFTPAQVIKKVHELLELRNHSAPKPQP